MRDGASVNAAAMRTVKIMYPEALDIRYISHTLDLIGDKFKVPHLSFSLSGYLSSLIVQSLKLYGRLELVTR